MCFCEIGGEGNRTRKIFSGRLACYQCWNLGLLASVVTYERQRASIVRQRTRNTDTRQWVNNGRCLAETLTAAVGLTQPPVYQVDLPIALHPGLKRSRCEADHLYVLWCRRQEFAPSRPHKFPSRGALHTNTSRNFI
jgi:hypothetical protein